MSALSHSLPSPARVLIAGGGFVGTALAERLREEGHEVIVLVKTPESAARVGGIAIDLGDGAAVRRLGASVGRVDQVVAAASTRGGDEASYRHVYLEGTRHLLAAFPGARLFFTGSTSVYGQSDGSVVTESSETRPASATSRVLLEAEQLVLAAGGVVVRFAGLYGAGRWITRDRFLDGSARLEGDGSDYLNLLHRDDAVAALLLLMKVPEASGVYNATDGTPLTRLELYTLLAAHYGKPLPPAAPPGVKRRRGRSHKRVTSARLTALGWHPTFPHIKAALKSGE